ncbi:MAG: GDSL-type esterase/lipase family protein [Verrucomicrobia bacterium]|nr:GDSL-type esterase/lipase family protein [Verrucomicrobiota bacterium]MDA1066656.1 GDSL-type esterase/lipase family protein [Verrucomicrobiota bacterium]
MMNSYVPKIVRLGLLLAVVGLSGNAIGANFQFGKGDHISIVGNSLAERMQHDGWMETLLHSEFADHELVFRNMAFPGDTIKKRPRSKGFTPEEEYLKLCETDVLFILFGYNESFAGNDGLAAFEKDLTEAIDRYRNLKPNGRSEPRLVLFSPIAHEDLEDRNLPDGKENNRRLSLYSKSIEKVATLKNVVYIDLFSASEELYKKTDEALTINGIHLTEEGNRLVAEVIVKELTGKNVNANADLETLRESVLDKSHHWFNRYRATDGNDVWGGRSTLTFVNNQTNREVLQNELVMFDVMTANRDKQIWARAKGHDIKVDDSNVPSPVSVISNVGGGSKSSNAAKEGSLGYLSGAEGLEKLTVPDGFEVNLFADEKMFPELVNPVQMAVDPRGRLWAAVWKNYPKWEPLTSMDDALLIFPDEDGDGVADKAITFAKVQNPTGFEFWNGGVLVASQPDILFLKDTDGDDVADVRIVMLHGIGSADTHHAANAFVFGPDGGLYWQSGIFLVNNIENPYGNALYTGEAGMFRFDPRRFTVNFHAPNRPNPHGISFDYWGYHYATDGTGGRAFQVVPDVQGFKMQQLLTNTVRPVPASGILSSTHFPEDMQNDFLICNAIGFLGIKRYNLDRIGATVTTIQGKRDKAKEVTLMLNHGEVWGNEAEDLLVSSDKNFRPSDIEFGADGALYIADWHNVIIGHMQHNVRDPNRDHERGRIYRMTVKDRPLQEPVDIVGASLEQLMQNLEHPVNGIRYRTRIELSSRNSEAVVAACKQWMKKFDPTKGEDAHHLLEALWLHQRHDVRDHSLLTSLLQSPEAHARNAAKTVYHFWYHMSPTGSMQAVVVENPEAVMQKSGIISETDSLLRIRIATVVEKMQYDFTEFSVKAGKKIELTFSNPDFMPHNIVFVEPESADAIATAALDLGTESFARNFVPEDDRIIIASGLVNYGEEETLVFSAPKKRGTYEFVCTFPGHHLLMRGIMVVTK